MNKRKFALYLVGAALALFIVAIVSWIIVESTVEVTSHADFCGVCHPMGPMIASYHKSTHGGNNPRGVMASCTDCHVSHESLFAHFAGKAKSGSHDVWVMVTKDTSKIDWQAKREDREEFVYDSGCLTCHRNLEKASYDNPKAFIAHRTYFAGDTRKQCVSCHKHVGHKDISDYISQK